MYIHDKNEYARGHNYLNHVSLDSFESKYIYLKISRMEMASDCEKSESYSFNKCVENHVIKVLEIFFPKKISRFIHLQAVGCKATWSDSDLDYPTCNLSETSKYLMKDQEMILSNIKLTNKTGCKPNCVFYKYEMAKIQPWTGTYDPSATSFSC